MIPYNLVYFNTTSRAELIRLLFIAAAQTFTDTRVPLSDWPGTLKAASPWGSLPYLEVYGEELGQSKAIIRYVAYQVGLGGYGAFEGGLVDSCVETCRDVWEDLYSYQYGDAAQKDNLRAKLKNRTLPGTLPYLEKFITKHGRNGYAVGGKLTTADLALFDAIDQIQTDTSAQIPDAAPANLYPRVNQVVATVRANPRISKYIAARSQPANA